MLEIHAFSQLQHQSDPDYIPFFVNTERLVNATKRIPALFNFTLKHLEQELAQVFIQNNREYMYNELKAKLKN